MGIILAIECAFEKNWSHLWIESDSKLAILAFKNTSIIPWQLKNRWSNCMIKIRDMQIIVSHVFREGNFVADKLANLGLSVNEFTWWNSAPSSIRADLARNRDGLPYFRFC
jgi:ribonuclease HI